jgi:hypothetical protein
MIGRILYAIGIIAGIESTNMPDMTLSIASAIVALIVIIAASYMLK